MLQDVDVKVQVQNTPGLWLQHLGTCLFHWIIRIVEKVHKTYYRDYSMWKEHNYVDAGHYNSELASTKTIIASY